MAFKDCIDAIKKAAGRDLSTEEAEAIFEAVEERIRREMGKGMTRADAGRKAGRELSEEMRLAIAIEKRSATINALVWTELSARRVEGREADAVTALVTGFAGRRGRPGNFRDAGLSVDAMGTAAAERSTGAVLADLQRAGMLDAVKRRDVDFERDIIREMWRLDDPNAGQPTGNKHAADVAAIMSKHLEISRLEQNKAGAWIGKVDHYVGRQSHDQYKVRGAGGDAGFQAWRDVIEPRLDPRTFDGMESPGERAAWLRSVWDALASGLHDSPNPDWQTGFKGFANLAKKVSQERKLHFASADAWMEYNAAFGHGNVFDAVMHGIERGQRNAAVMRVLGTNPQAMFDRLVSDWQEQAKARGDFAQVDRLRAEAGKNSRILDRAMHKTIGAENQTIANVGAMHRNLHMFKLGASMLSSFTDIAAIGATARHNGVGVFHSMADSVAGLLPTDSAARREAALELGLMLDGINNSVVNRFMAQDSPNGMAAGLVKTFMRWSGQNWWTANMKEAFGMSLGNNLARVSGQSFEALPGRLQTTLRRYGIEAAEWDAIRRGSAKAVDGNDYLFPASVLDLPDDAVAGLGKTPEAARVALHDKLSTYVIDQTREAMSEPTAGLRDLFTGGSAAPGSATGEAARMFWQFKSFPTTFVSRAIMRELFRDGMDAGGVATIIAGTTALGYIAMTLKEIAKGREPRTPEEPKDYAKLVMAAMAQGGGFGLYGDFLFGEANRFGAGPVLSAMGPGVSGLNDFGQVLGALRNGDFKAAQAEAFGLAKQLPPASMLNLWFTRAAADYLIFWRIQDMINPGWARRYEQRVKRENDQTFWLSPTEAVR